MKIVFDLIVYHADCPDGVCAAWVASKCSPSAQLLAAKYGDAPPDCRGLRVLVVDFSYPRSQLLEMQAEAVHLQVLDHHKSAAEALAGLPFCTFDMNHSGARLAWDYFHPGEAPPWMVDYVEDRDLWRWALPYSREVSAVLQSYHMTIETFENFSMKNSLAGDLLGVQRDGRAILRYQQRLVESAVKHAREETIGGVLVPCVESTVLKSEIGEALSEGKPFAAIWSENEKGERVYSLRSRPDGLDVSEIATKYPGGGGHPRAAGFTRPH